MKNLFQKNDLDSTIQRINNLSSDSKANWGKMKVAQMLAHCNVSYEMTYDNIHPKPGAVKRFIIKLLVKQAVVGSKPYPKNGRTAPQFIISGDRDFEKEKHRLITYLEKTQELGASHFDGKENLSFGALSSSEWNIMFSKHLDHHLTQFGV